MASIYVKTECEWASWQAGLAALPLLVPGDLMASHEPEDAPRTVDVVLLASVWFGQTPHVLGTLRLADVVARARRVEPTFDLYNVATPGKHRDDALYLLDPMRVERPPRQRIDHAYILGWSPYLAPCPAAIQESRRPVSP